MLFYPVLFRGGPRTKILIYERTLQYPEKGERKIKRQFTLKIDNAPIRFTPDEKVAVVDAIKALSALGEPESVWESLKAECSEINGLYQDYDFHENKSEAVVDLNGWDKIETALLDYMLDHDCSP